MEHIRIDIDIDIDMQLIPGGRKKSSKYYFGFLIEKKYFLNLIEMIRFFQMLLKIWGLRSPPTSPTPQSFVQIMSSMAIFKKITIFDTIFLDKQVLCPFDFSIVLFVSFFQYPKIAPRGSSFRLFHSPLIGSINIQVLGSSFPLFGSLDKYYIDCGGTSWPYPTCRVVLLTIILLHLFRWKLDNKQTGRKSIEKGPFFTGS